MRLLLSLGHTGEIWSIWFGVGIDWSVVEMTKLSKFGIYQI